MRYLDRGFEPRSGQTKDYIFRICCLSANHAALRSKSKDWLARNEGNVSEWSHMFTRGLLFQWATTIKIQLSELVWNKADLIIISWKFACFRHDIAEQLRNWRKTTITHSLSRSCVCVCVLRNVRISNIKAYNIGLLRYHLFHIIFRLTWINQNDLVFYILYYT